METEVKDLIRESVRKKLIANGAPENHFLDIMTEKVLTCIVALADNDSDVRAATQDLWEISTQTIGNNPVEIVRMLDGILKMFPNEIEAYAHYLSHSEDEPEVSIETIKNIINK